jgi:hypothetical protein
MALLETAASGGFTAWIDSTGIATYIRENSFAFPWLECFHIMATALVLGVISIVDLRLMGLAATGYRTSRLMRALLPLTWGAFIVALVTGVLLFTSQPALYLENTAFRIKLALLLLAGLNMAIFHLWTQRGIAVWDEEGPIPVGARLAGLISLCLWVGVVFAGRFVGFTIDAFGAL